MERFWNANKSKKVVRSRDIPTIMMSVCAKQESKSVESIQRSWQSYGCQTSGQDISPNMVALLLITTEGLSQRPHEIAADDELHVGTSSFKFLCTSCAPAHSCPLLAINELHDGRTMLIFLDVTREKHGLWTICEGSYVQKPKQYYHKKGNHSQPNDNHLYYYDKSVKT